jgi:hypothetical protein
MEEAVTQETKTPLLAEDDCLFRSLSRTAHGAFEAAQADFLRKYLSYGQNAI